MEENKEEYINRDPFQQPNIIVLHIDTERKGSRYNLSRDEIRELGFLRSNPSRFRYQHIDKPYLELEEIYEQNFGVKDFADERIVIKSKGVIVYNSNTPSKGEVQDIIDNN